MLNGHIHEIPVSVQIDVNICAYFSSFLHGMGGKLNECRVGICEVFNVHSLKSRSKNAL